MSDKNSSVNPDQCGSAGWAHTTKQKVSGFDSQSGHLPGLQVQSQWGTVHARSNQSMFLSLSFSLSKNKFFFEKIAP